MMRDAVICEPVRTPIGRYGGSLRALSAPQLGAQLLRALVDRTALDPMAIDDVVVGCGNATSEAPALGRVIALDAGMPIDVPGYHLDRRCGSGLQAVLNAAMAVQTGMQDLVVAGGVESMSNAVFYSSDMRWGAPRTGVTMHDQLVRGRVSAGGINFPVPGGMIETAENLRREYRITRDAQDALAVESHRRAVAAQESGALAAEVIPVVIPDRRGDHVVDRDEHPRADTTMEALAQLTPIMARQDPEATVTAGNASGQNDAAALAIVTTPDVARRHGLIPLVRLLGWAVAGTAPRTMGIGPVPATAKVLSRLGLTLADMDLIELNEAFAAQALSVMTEWKFTDADRERTNVLGSGISLGHPVGATGARMLATLARQLVEREGRYGLETMCIGGGQGLAAVFEAF